MFDYAFFLFAFSSLFTLIDPITTICNYTRHSHRLGLIREQAAKTCEARSTGKRLRGVKHEIR